MTKPHNFPEPPQDGGEAPTTSAEPIRDYYGAARITAGVIGSVAAGLHMVFGIVDGVHLNNALEREETVSDTPNSSVVIEVENAGPFMGNGEAVEFIYIPPAGQSATEPSLMQNFSQAQAADAWEDLKGDGAGFLLSAGVLTGLLLTRREKA